MSSKLTLSINESTIEQAKAYAKASGKSLSNIVEEYLKSLTRKGTVDKKKASLQIVKELKGSVNLADRDISYKELLQEALLEKKLKK